MDLSTFLPMAQIAGIKIRAFAAVRICEDGRVLAIEPYRVAEGEGKFKEGLNHVYVGFEGTVSVIVA